MDSISPEVQYCNTSNLLRGFQLSNEFNRKCFTFCIISLNASSSVESDLFV